MVAQTVMELATCVPAPESGQAALALECQAPIPGPDKTNSAFS